MSEWACGDLPPDWFPFLVAAAAWGILVCQGIARSFSPSNKDLQILNGPITEFLLVLGLNGLIMSLSIYGYFVQVKYAVLGIAVLVLFRDIVSAYVITHRDPETSKRALERTFPPFVFSQTFRERYIQAMSDEATTFKACSIYADLVGSDFRRILLLAMAQLVS
jgi:hypothetical protein